MISYIRSPLPQLERSCRGFPPAPPFSCWRPRLPSSAQNATATARLGPGQSVTVTAAKATGDSASLEIALPKGAQRFDGIGEQFLSLKSGGRDSTLVVADLNGDGIDEIVVRGSVPPTPARLSSISGTPSAANIFPVDFTERSGRGKTIPVRRCRAARSRRQRRDRVRSTRVDQSGRTLHRGALQWNGEGFQFTLPTTESWPN